MLEQSEETMRKHLLAFVAIVAGIALTSCSSYYRVNSTPKVLEPSVAPVHATLEVRQSKITYVYQQTFSKSAIVDENQLRENALYEAIAQARADVLVAPTFKTELEIDGRKYYTVTVSGYPADYSEFVQEKALMEPRQLETKELKKDAAYLFINKDQNGNLVDFEVVGTGKDAIVVAPKTVPADGPKVVVEEKRTIVSSEPAPKKVFGKKKAKK